MDRRTFIGLSVLTGCAFAIPRSLWADANTWFDETLTDWRLSSTGSGEWVTSAGRWMPEAGDESACSESAHVVHVRNFDGNLLYRPCVLDGNGKPSATTKSSECNAVTKVTMSNVTFTAYGCGAEWERVDPTMSCGLAMRRHNDGNCTFVGWATTRDSSCIRGRWLELSAVGVTASEDAEYAVVIEADFSSIPNRLRYSVNGRHLRDAKGNEWFSFRKASLDPSVGSRVCASEIGFTGRGSVGRIVAETTAPPVPRGIVSAPRLARPSPGATLDASTFALDGPALGANVTYRWYLTDAAGRAVPNSDRGTEAAYVLTSDDYGHWVSVDISDESGFYGTGRLWFSNLPVVYIDCKDAKGWIEAEETAAVAGKTYYWADADDVFRPVDGIVAGDDLAPFRERCGSLFLKDVKTAWPTAKKEDHTAYVYMTGNVEWGVQYTADGAVEDGEEIVSKIHVRGNSTAGQDKKPYKIKLGKKADLFGLGGGVKNKHWVLLANSFDESLMRNKLCYDYSAELGLVAMRSTWVDVVMNGKFVGNYQLCQHIRVAEERIDIYDWSEAYEKIAEAAQKANPALTDDDVGEIETLLEEHQEWMGNGRFTYLGTNYTTVSRGESGPDGKGGFTVVWKNYSNDISGGYVFELDRRKSGQSATTPAASTFEQTHVGRGSYRFCLAMNTPEYCFSSPDVSNAVWNCWNDIGEAWASGTGYDRKGRHYSELCDFDSMVNYWLSIHVPGNNDAYGLSRYAYKDRGGKVVFGPAWDFDYGLDSLQIRSYRPTETNVHGEVTYAPIFATGWIPGAGSDNFVGGWTGDPYFMYKLREKYWATRAYLADMVKDGGLIDRYVEYLGPSARANDLRWNNRIGFFGDDKEMGDAYVVKEFLRQRFAWLDGQFEANVGNALPKLTQTATDSGRYRRSPEIVPAVVGATPVPDSAETDLPDVALTVKAAPIVVTVAVPTESAALLDVYVNGRSNGTFAVSSQTALTLIPAAALKSGERNFVQFLVRASDGTPLASNVALVTANLPAAVDAGTGPDRVPVPVRISWLDEAYLALARTGAVDPADAPKSYADYVSFAKTPSPIGKATLPWQDFVSDTDPANSNSVFKASIEIGADGLPRVSWSPDRSSTGGTVVRSYTLRGTNDLATDPKNWDSIRVSGDDDFGSEAFRRAHRFFFVEVDLP